MGGGKPYSQKEEGSSACGAMFLSVRALTRRTTGSARRAGRFRGSYECCLRQRPMSESEHNPSTQPAAPAAPLRAL